MVLDSFQWCPATKRGTMATTEIQEVSLQHEEELLHVEGGLALAEGGPGRSGSLLLWDIPNPPGAPV